MLLLVALSGRFLHAKIGGKMKYKLIILCLALLCCSNAYAATVGNTSDTKIPYGPGIFDMHDNYYNKGNNFGSFRMGFDGEWIFDRDLDPGDGKTSGDLEGQKYLFKIGYAIAERVEPYIKVGVSNLKTYWNEQSQPIEAKGEDGFVLGGGGKVLIFDIPEHRIRISCDGHYLFTDSEIKKAKVGAAVSPVSADEFEVKEWQITGILSMEFPISYDKYNSAAVYSLIPYVGFAYFDSEVKSQFTHNGREYNIGKAKNDSNFLLIGGCDFTSPQNIVFNIEGRFIGETAASSGLTVKF